MNRNCYRLVFNAAAGMMVPRAETARGRGKEGGHAGPAGVLLAGVLLAAGALPGAALAEMPRPQGVLNLPGFVTAGQAGYQVNGNQAFVNQVGDKAILNWRTFNVSAGNDVQFRQVESLAGGQLVPGASFTSLNRIWDVNPSVIAGSLSQGEGQKANVILVNANGIAFMGGSQVNLNSFTASSLDIDNDFILKSFLTNQTLPQFTGTGGFVKVFEGARITAGSQGRVMLIAPTVVNKGTVEAPDGQVIAAAGSKVYLRSAAGADSDVRGLLVEVDSPADLASFETANTGVGGGVLDGRKVALADAATDKLGHATNLGELASPRGNVTMVGYAVNQQGIARATTSVVANGSVYLLAKDRAVGNATSERGGRVTLGENSLTQVLPEVADATTTLDLVDRAGAADRTVLSGLARASQVKVLGQDVRVAGGAAIDAPSGRVNLIAMDNPSLLDSPGDPFKTVASAVSESARIHVASGARINVAGLADVPVPVARNSVEVELRGDELKDSPVNREGPLRGEKVYVDVNRALASADAGKSTLMARDSLESYQARLQRTVAERSTAGGTVSVRSHGQTVLEAGAVIDLSGGSLHYTPGNVRTTQLFSGAALTDVTDARAETRYDGIASRYVIDHGRWNQKEVIEAPQSYRYDPGYREGKNAGAMSVISMGPALMQAAVQGRTTLGELQREGGPIPAGATLTLGTDAVAGDYKLNQKVDLVSTAATLPPGFGLGQSLPEELKDRVTLDPGLLGRDKVAHLQVFSNQAAAVREALRAPQGGSVAITAKGVSIDADVEAAAGKLSFSARSNRVDLAILPLDVTVADGALLSARGGWANDLPAAQGRTPDATRVHGGAITLSAEGNVNLGRGALIDVTGGGRLKPDRKLVNGNGGNVTLEAGGGASASAVGLLTAAMKLGGEVRGHALGKGGTLTVNTEKIRIGGTPDDAALNLDAGFVARGGFSHFRLTGRDGVTVAQGTLLKPAVDSLELEPDFLLQPTGGRIEDFTRIERRDDRRRQPANLTLTADGTERGEVLLEAGAGIVADDRAAVTFNGGSRIHIEGQVRTAGGTISANLNPLVPPAGQPQTGAIWLGSDAVLDASGAARTYTDASGRQVGEVLAGGTVNLNAQRGYVVTQSNSRVAVNGVAPVRLDVPNEAGTAGRMVGSDAGTVNIAAHDGIALDGTLQAQAGGPSHRGGRFDLRYVLVDDDLINGVSPVQRVLSVAQSVAPQAVGPRPDAGDSTGLLDQARVGAGALEAAGFETISLKARHAIALENGLKLGEGTARPLREIKLDAPRIETAGGDAALAAHTVRIGNFDAERQSVANAPAAGTGTFKADAQLLELAGNQTFTGMGRAELTGAQEVRLSGVSTPGEPRPFGTLELAADLNVGAAVVAPAAYSRFTIDAAGRKVEFTPHTSQPVQPLSALGSVTVKARDIVQGGNLWAPLGQIDLQAQRGLVFKYGSLTSVGAAPGSLIPFGKVVNGRNWLYDVASSGIAIAALPEKSIRAKGSSVDMRAGARIDLAGGGDLQAYEFTVGPGGSRDRLADGAGTYAIVPGFKGGFAPADAQEPLDRPSGEAVYLSGVPGLADGVYTLLPAHYALLPGAYAVKLNTGITDLMPGQAYDRQDGVRIAAGYLTDSRENAPKDASWRGIEVLTHEQVRARSEFTLTPASAFFADTGTRPQDAGLLSLVTTGTRGDSLKLDAAYHLAGGAGGRGAAVDISAPRIEMTSGARSGADSTATLIDVAKLNALGAQSLLVGGTRRVASGGATEGPATALQVDAESVTLDNANGPALQAAELMLVATDILALKSGSRIAAQGEAGDSGRYTTAGNGALVRAGSTTAEFERGGSPDRTRGVLTAEAGSRVVAADSITLDATRATSFNGTTEFRKNGAAVAGNLAVGATRINFGAAPVIRPDWTFTEGVTYRQPALDELSKLKSLALTSYSTFDLYGGVDIGGVDAGGKPTLETLALRGAGLAGLANTGKTATLRAQNITLSNPSAAPFTPGGVPGDGALTVVADTLTLGRGDKSIRGFGKVGITANEMVGEGVGKTDIAAAASVAVARLRGGSGSDQTLASSGALDVAGHAADRELAAVNELGAKWALAGAGLRFNAHALLPSGGFKLTASHGDLKLGAQAEVDVAGRGVAFFDVTQPTWGGTAEFVSNGGNVSFATGAKVDVSGAAGADAGTLVVRAAQGAVALADGSVRGVSPVDAEGRRGDGAKVEVDTGTLAGFSALNAALNSGGFDGERTLRVRSGDVRVAAADSVKAQTIRIAADGGMLEVAGRLDASGADAGRIELFAKNDVNLKAGAQLDAASAGPGKEGGDIEMGTREGSLDVASGSAIDVAGGLGGVGGTVVLRAPRTGAGAGTGVAVKALDGSLAGARSVAVEAVKVYENIATLSASGPSSGSTLSLAKVNADNTEFAAKHASIKTRLGKTADPAFHIRSGVEVRSAGDLALGTGAATTDWNLGTSRAGGEPGVLTLRAVGNLKINSNLSDGFSHASPCKTATCTGQNPSPATLMAGDSWSYRLVAGADRAAADPLAVKAGAGDVTLAAGKLVRTGTGDIRIASGRDIKLASNASAIYTAGHAAAPLAGFTAPVNAQFSQGGGDVHLAARGDIVGAPSAQLYSNWLFRQGRMNANGSAYSTQPAWWVRFDQFQQGVGALGGGNVTFTAGGKIENVSASAPTQARMAAATPVAQGLLKTGGGEVRVETGGDLLGGQYYADRGDVLLKVGGKIDTGQSVGRSPLYTIAALGDARARVRAQADVNLHTVLNPHLVVQSSGSGTAVNITNATDSQWSLFSTYGQDSGASLASLHGNVALHNGGGGSARVQDAYRAPLALWSALNYKTDLLSYLPPSVSATAFQGDIVLQGTQAILSPAPRSGLTMLAANSVSLPAKVTMSDMDSALIPDAVRPGTTYSQFNPALGATRHAVVPVHSGDPEPVRVYAVAGDVVGESNAVSLTLPKAVWVRAGRDVRNLGIAAQHVGAEDVSRIEAGRDVAFAESSGRDGGSYVWLGGPGRLEVTAGRNVALGTSAGIASRGGLDNAALPKQGADIHVTAGVGPGGVDYAAAVGRMIEKLEAGGVDDATLWQARWLTGDRTLTAANALAAVKAVKALDGEGQRGRVREMIYAALEDTGRDSNNPESPYAADYQRGYAALELVFPGIGEKTPDGRFKNYQGEVNLFASRILTERGGNIELMIPGGGMVVGLSNTRKEVLATQKFITGTEVGLTDSGPLGLVTVEAGAIRGFARDNILVNQSRILTVGGGDILLWSSEGDIDAGKGKKTASSVPAPVIRVDSQGNVTQELQGAATGSGIGALSSGGVKAGDVDLIAPRGTVNAGDAGIRAGNLNIAAQVVLGADNITVSGTSAGTPVADTSAITATASGAVTAGGDVASTLAAINQATTEAAKNAQALSESLKPVFVRVDVLGFGE